MFGFGKATDPICGMKVEKKTAIVAHGQYFCAQACADEYGKAVRSHEKAVAHKGGGCCH